ncbi:hypothetical protein TKK_0010156 [Trichogramma kaykai]
MAAVAYLRHQLGDRVQLSLLVSRTKLASIRSLKDDPRKEPRITIPRLELRAAYLAVRLLHSICSELPMRIENCVAWTDSRIALHWIRSTEPTALHGCQTHLKRGRQLTARSTASPSAARPYVFMSQPRKFQPMITSLGSQISADCYDSWSAYDGGFNASSIADRHLRSLVQ